MFSHLFQVEKAEGPPRLMKIRFVKDASASELFAGLQAFFENAFAERCSHFVLDMRELLYPSTNLIALLISARVRARQLKGEVILKNVAHSARDNFLTFSAFNFLAAGQEAAPSEISSAFAASAPDSKEIDFDAAALVEIAEPPVVRQLDKALHPQRVQDFFVVPNAVGELQIKTQTCRVESQAANLYRLCDFVVEHARRAGVKDKEISKIRIAVYEACLNVIEHAYHSNPENWIEVSVHYTSDRFVIVILDYGHSFDLKPIKEYNVQEAVEARRTGGFGMHIIKRAVDHLEYFPDMLKGNRLVLTKNLR